MLTSLIEILSPVCYDLIQGTVKFILAFTGFMFRVNASNCGRLLSWFITTQCIFKLNNYNELFKEKIKISLQF